MEYFSLEYSIQETTLSVSQTVYIYQLLSPPCPSASTTLPYNSLIVDHINPHCLRILISLDPAKMDEYCLPRTQVPERLYRVQYDKSMTNDVEKGLTANNMQTFTEDTAKFGSAVENHINDYNDEGTSMFISTFASKAQAEDWMCRKWRSYGKGAQILEIETRHLGHGFVYRAGEVAQALELDTSYTTYDDLSSEYLILHFIPARAIVARRAKMVTPKLEDDASPAPSPQTGSISATVTEASTVTKKKPRNRSVVVAQYQCSEYSDNGSRETSIRSRR
ncbi:unnamed protein product [Penicillium nalgiovense]|nr:unnamed protein product [Penicillium nalgiovense]